MRLGSFHILIAIFGIFMFATGCLSNIDSFDPIQFILFLIGSIVISIYTSYGIVFLWSKENKLSDKEEMTHNTGKASK